MDHGDFTREALYLNIQWSEFLRVEVRRDFNDELRREIKYRGHCDIVKSLIVIFNS